MQSVQCSTSTLGLTCKSSLHIQERQYDFCHVKRRPLSTSILCTFCVNFVFVLFGDKIGQAHLLREMSAIVRGKEIQNQGSQGKLKILPLPQAS